MFVYVWIRGRKTQNQTVLCCTLSQVRCFQALYHRDTYLIRVLFRVYSVATKSKISPPVLEMAPGVRHNQKFPLFRLALIQILDVCISPPKFQVALVSFHCFNSKRA